MSGYRFSRSRLNLGAGTCWRSDGWAGTNCWMSRVDGAAASVLPKNFPAPDPRRQVGQFLRRSREALRASGSVDLGPLRKSNKTYVHPLSHHGVAWPYQVNAYFVEHVEQCWPFGHWALSANGMLLRYEIRGGRRVLRGVVMLIRSADGPSWEHA